MQSTQDPIKPKKTLSWLVLAGFLGVILIILAVIGVPLIFNQDSSDPESDDGLDVANASFYLADRGVTGELVSLADGVYYPHGTSGDAPHMRLIYQKEGIDVNSDDIADVIAVLEWTGKGTSDYDSWRGVYAWFGNADNEFHPYEHLLAWEWNCAALDQASELPFESFIQAVESGVTMQHNSANRCGDDIPSQSKFDSLFVAIIDGYPVNVSLQGFVTATEGCARWGDDFTSSDFIEVTDSLPLAFPNPDAPPVSARSDYVNKEATIAVWAPDAANIELTELRGGYIPANISWPEGPTVCGWISETDL